MRLPVYTLIYLYTGCYDFTVIISHVKQYFLLKQTIILVIHVVLAAWGTNPCVGKSVRAGSQSQGHLSGAGPSQPTGGVGQRRPGLEGERSQDIPHEELALLAP